mgnify:CR=1 FL=1
MRKLATIEKIVDIQPIDGADSIEKVKVRGWWCVAKKGEFQVGSDCVYFEIDSLVPSSNPVFDFLKKGGSEKTMVVDGKEYKGYRLKTIRLRGQISQGLALPISMFSVSGNVGDDVSEQIGVVKYEAPIPAQLSGKVKGSFPSFMPKTDEERIQNMSDVLGGFYVTEKLDGASVSYFKKDGVFGVCSRNLELEDSEWNSQWEYARSVGLIDKMPNNFALQGEIVGEGIQGNSLGIKGKEVYFFNAYNIASGEYLDFKNFKTMIDGLGLKTVPILDENFSLPKTVDEMLKYAEGKSQLNPSVEREGVVVRPKVEMRYGGSRFSFKAISNKFLENE